jgi:hypothetical protein
VGPFGPNGVESPHQVANEATNYTNAGAKTYDFDAEGQINYWANGYPNLDDEIIYPGGAPYYGTGVM